MSRNLEKIYVVFKTHFDIGFTGLVSEVVDTYRTDMLKDVIGICEQTKTNPEHEKYVWTMSAWPLLQSLEGSGEQDRNKAKQFLENGQLIWHKLPHTTHTEFCGMEEWIRGMYVSRGLTEKYSYNPRDAKMTDVPGHTWIVPSLLKKAGVDILHLGCNGASTPPDVPPVFYWEGPDGDRLLTFYSKGGYGTGIIPPEEWEHPVWLALIHTNDNHGPHEPTIIDELKSHMKDKGVTAELHIGSLGDFAQDFLSRNPELPVVRGDMADAWIHGVGTAPREVSRVREMRGRIAGAESALSLSLFNGETVNGEAAKQHIDRSYEHTLLFGEHTWGMDCKTFLFPRVYDKKSFQRDKETPRYQKMELSWQEQRDYLNTAEASLKLAVEQVAAGTTVGCSSEKLRVYNHLGWARDAKVQLEKEQFPKEDELWIDCVTGEKLEMVSDNVGTFVLVKGLPALGYRSISKMKTDEAQSATIKKSSVRTELTDWEIILENAHLLIKINRTTGLINSLYDKRTDKEWIDEGASNGFGQYEYNIYSNEEITRYLKKYAYRFLDWGIKDFAKTDYPEQQKRLSFSAKLKELQAIEDSFGVRVECVAGSSPSSVEEYGNAGEIRWAITLANDASYLDMEWRLNGKEETPLAESGHILFPLKARDPQYRINKMGSVMDPCTDLVPYSSTLLNCCEHFVDVTDGDAGLAVIPLDTPLFFIGRNGMWDYEPAYKPEKPELNFNLFNNWWGTNFPQWIGGELRYRYRIFPHAGDWNKAEVWKIAQETLTPVLAVPAEPASAKGELLELLPGGLDGMTVTCFKPAEDGDGYILRLRDWSGKARETVIGFSDLIKDVQMTDLLEYGGVPLKLELAGSQCGRQVRFQAKGFDVVTLRIR